MKHIDIERVRKESANVLVIENANPGAPHLQSVYVDDLCDAIDSLRARAEKAEATADRYLAAMREWVDDGSAPRAIRAIVEEVKP